MNPGEKQMMYKGSKGKEIKMTIYINKTLKRQITEKIKNQRLFLWNSNKINKTPSKTYTNNRTETN